MAGSGDWAAVEGDGLANCFGAAPGVVGAPTSSAVVSAYFTFGWFAEFLVTVAGRARLTEAVLCDAWGQAICRYRRWS